MTIKRRKTVHTAARVKRRLRPAAPKVARARSSDAGDITSKPMLIGYARVSTVDQNLALQRDALTEGCRVRLQTARRYMTRSNSRAAATRLSCGSKLRSNSALCGASHKADDAERVIMRSVVAGVLSQLGSDGGALRIIPGHGGG